MKINNYHRITNKFKILIKFHQCTANNLMPYLNLINFPIINKPNLIKKYLLSLQVHLKNIT